MSISVNERSVSVAFSQQLIYCSITNYVMQAFLQKFLFDHLLYIFAVISRVREHI